MTRFYLDTEFDENGKTIELISIALVRDDGRELYLASNEFDPNRCNDWVKENVLPKLPHQDHWISRLSIAGWVREFTQRNGLEDEIEIWGYFSDYDWVAFCQLFGPMINLPKHLPMYCLDLKQLALSMDITESLETLVPIDPKLAHTALGDAQWNRAVHEVLMTRRNGQPLSTRRCATCDHTEADHNKPPRAESVPPTACMRGTGDGSVCDCAAFDARPSEIRVMRLLDQQCPAGFLCVHEIKCPGTR